MAKAKVVGGQEVVATQDGFYKGARIRAGKTFIFEGKKLGKWMKATGKVEERPVEEPAETPAE